MQKRGFIMNEYLKKQDASTRLILTYVGGKIIGFNANLARALGSNNAALFLQQCLYWTTRTADKEGWFYKTIEEFYEELNLTRREQESVIKILTKHKILEKEVKGVPPKRYFRINLLALREFLESPSICTKTPNQFAQKRQIDLAESDKLTHRVPEDYNKEYNQYDGFFAKASKNPPID